MAFDDIVPLPENPERYLAGRCLRGAEAATDLLSRIRLDDLADYPSRLVIETVTDLLADRREPTCAAVLALIDRRGKRADLGQFPDRFLRDLFDLAPGEANVTLFIDLVRERSLRRRLRVLGNQLAYEADNPSGAVEEMVAAVERGLRELAEDTSARGPVSAADAIRDALARYDDTTPRPVVPTGFADLDAAMSGGFRPGELVLIASRPGGGKSALCLRLAEEAAENGAGVLFFGLEMPTGETVDRLLSGMARVPLPKLRGQGRIEPAEAKRLTDQLDSECASKVWFDDRAGLTAGQIGAATRRFVRRHGVKLIIIDYLQLVMADDRKAPRYEQVGAVSRALKLLAKDAGVTVVAAAQLNRDGDCNDVPRLSHLRESGSLEQDADAVFLLHQPAPADPTSSTLNVDLLLAKQRNGVSGIKIPLHYRRAFTRFESYVPT